MSINANAQRAENNEADAGLQPDDTPSTNGRGRTVHFGRPPATVGALVIIVAGAWALIRLLPVVLALVAAFILISTMNPAVRWLRAHRVERSAGIAIVFTSFFLAALLLITLSVPHIISQAASLIDKEPEIRARLVTLLAGSHLTAPFADSLRNARSDALEKYFAETVLTYSKRIAEIIGYGVSAIFLALYLMIDRDRMRGGLFAVVPRPYHIRLSRIMVKLETIVGAYIRGQIIISALMAAFVFMLLVACRVPNALALAVFAGAVDILPYIGVFLSMGPVIVAAYANGPVITVVVLVLMLAYEEFESRVLVPRVYGRTLRLPSFAVLLAILAGGSLFGIVGMFLSLPVAATIRMLIEELRIKLPGEQGRIQAVEQRRQREDYAEQEYYRRAGDMPAAQAAAIALEISRKLQQEDDFPLLIMAGEHETGDDPENNKEGYMNIKKIRDIAAAKGVVAGDMPKLDLIRAIQRVEGYLDCYSSSRVSSCPEMNCLWRQDCLKGSAQAKTG